MLSPLAKIAHKQGEIKLCFTQMSVNHNKKMRVIQPGLRRRMLSGNEIVMEDVAEELIIDNNSTVTYLTKFFSSALISFFSSFTSQVLFT